jgi:hypothetical protein
VDPLPTVTGVSSASITSPPTATDNCVGAVTGTTTDPLAYTSPGTYTVTWIYDDGNGNTSTQPQTVVVENGLPIVDAHGPYTVDEGGSMLLTATGSDPDDDSLTYEWDLDYDGVTFTADAVGASVPFSAAALSGPAARVVAARATDTASGSATDTATLMILNVVPTAADDAYTTYEGFPLTVGAPGVLGNDSDPVDTLHAGLATGPDHGTLTTFVHDGSFTYTPAVGFSGTDSFTYAAHDGDSFALATVTITVLPVFDASGQSEAVNEFLRYLSPTGNPVGLPSGTTGFELTMLYGPTTIPASFTAVLNGTPVTGLFSPAPGTTNTVPIPLEPGRNVLVLKVEGTLPTGRVATERDRLVFIVG